MNKNIKCIPFPNIKDAYIVISGYKTHKGNGVHTNISFFYAGPEIGVEWEPDYGPITIILECDKDNIAAEEHYFYPYCTGYGAWSQLAVKEEKLTEKFISGNYKGIFKVLKRWAK